MGWHPSLPDFVSKPGKLLRTDRCRQVSMEQQMIGELFFFLP
jgi:hypothetical protein